MFTDLLISHCFRMKMCFLPHHFSLPVSPHTPASPRPCTCLVRAAVGGRVLAVRGTFQRRSHPVNPLGLGPLSHLPYLQYPSSTSHSPTITHSTRLPFSALVRLKWDTAMSKVDTVRMRLKDEYIPHTHPPSCSQAQSF